MKTSVPLLVVVALAMLPVLRAEVSADRREIIFSGVQSATSAPEFVTLLNTDAAAVALELRIAGPDAVAFSVFGSPTVTLKPVEARVAGVVFNPPAGRIGALHASCEIVTAQGDVVAMVPLHGLSALGIEGPREAPMDQILATLGYAVDIGWSGLKGNVLAEPLGEEIAAPSFRRSGPGEVTMRPIARYSPDYPLPFGYYRMNGDQPRLVPIGTLARASATRFEHNCLFPTIATGGMTFDPGDEPFGLFTASPTHVAYTEDALNARLEPTHVAHAVRIYPARDRDGRLMAHTYLVGFEEASNGDYQDYLFLLTNVSPVP